MDCGSPPGQGGNRSRAGGWTETGTKPTRKRFSTRGKGPNMSLTLVITLNVILAVLVLVAIVGSHAWAVATAHRDHVGNITLRPSDAVAVAVVDVDVEEEPQRVAEAALV